MKIALLGDIALFGKMSIKENPSAADRFSEIANYLERFDFVVGNLETPFSVEKKTSGAKSAYICADVENVLTLKQLHINAVCLSNNHMFDFGKEGYETTKKVLNENGIEYYGAEGKELKIQKDGARIAFSGFCCYTSNPLICVTYGNYGVNAFNLECVKERLKSNEKDGFLNIIAVHAGLEHVNYPSIEHIRAARKLAKVAPYVYYGHHPHVIQGVEEYKGSLIAHSLGNFCFDDIYTQASGSKPLIELTENNRRGMILELTIEGNKVTDWKLKIVYNSKENGLQLIEDVDYLNEYNKALADSEINTLTYNQKRNNIIDTWAKNRKTARNLMWYIKRLRPRYVRLFFNARNNTKKYRNNVLKYLQND